MNTETMQVFSGSAISPEELLVLAEFAAPSYFVSDGQLPERGGQASPSGPTTGRAPSSPRCTWHHAGTFIPP